LQVKKNCLLELASKGTLLPDFDYEWQDDFKSAYAHQLTDLLITRSRRYQIGAHDELLMKIADVMFVLDSMSEFALSLKSTLLRNQGEYAKAKNLYNGSIKDYKALLGVEFNRSYEELHP
jgi:two-component SAPR family response regulator